jgi:SAM-dependent methyltransferase
MEPDSPTPTTTLRASVELACEPGHAFTQVVEQLALALDRIGIVFETGHRGRVVEEGFEVGTVLDWSPGERVSLRWLPADWEPGEVTEVEFRFEPDGAGTRVVLEHRGWGGLVGDADDLAGWFAAAVAAPLLRAAAPVAFGDWLTDRRARRPSGPAARETYRDPLYHYPNFRVLLEELALTAEDVLLEIGCGGGALLKEALASGCRAKAVDHSPEMLAVAREANRDAVDHGRLELRQASAESLPFADATFTRAVMTAVLGFLPDPVAAFREIKRVLVPGGRFVGLGSDPEMRGTPAAPEPMASRLHFYESGELERLARDAGFEQVTVIRRDLEEYARDVGVPEEHLALFSGGGGARFLLARKG